jgi:hypothetical protein
LYWLLVHESVCWKYFVAANPEVCVCQYIHYSVLFVPWGEEEHTLGVFRQEAWGHTYPVVFTRSIHTR